MKSLWSAKKQPRWRFLLVLATAVASLVGASAEARLVISPATITVSLDKGRPRGTFQLTNVGEHTERYRVKAVHFNLSEEGSLLLRAPDELSLAPWVRFNPREFEIPPNARRVIRYSLPAPKDLANGEYWGGIEFEPLKGTLTSYSDDQGRNYNITVLTSSMVTIFGQKGEPHYELSVAGADLATLDDSTLLTVHLQNVGMGKLNLLGGRFELSDGVGGPVAAGELPPFPLLREGKRNLKVELEPGVPPGQYKLKIHIEARQLDAPVQAEMSVALSER